MISLLIIGIVFAWDRLSIDRPLTALNLSWYICCLVLFGLVLAGIGNAGKLFASFRDIKISTWLIILSLILIDLFVLQPLVLHNIWDPNNHGICRVGDIIAGSRELDLSQIHGFGYFVLVKACFDLVFFQQLSVFAVTYFLSALVLLLFFLFVWQCFDNERLALISAALLLFLPVQLRLAATECMFVPVEFYLLSTLLLFTLYVKRGQEGFFWAGLGTLFLLMQTRAEMLFLAPLLTAAFFTVINPQRLGQIFRSRTGVFSLVVFSILFIPWLLHISGVSEPRFRGPVFLRVLKYCAATLNDFGAPNAFFAAQYTPFIYPLFFLIGLYFLFQKEKRWFVFLNICWVSIALFYVHYMDSISTYLRTALASQWCFVLIAAIGVESSIRTLAKRPWLQTVYLAVITLCFILSLLPYRGFLSRIYATQQEFDLLQWTRQSIPHHSILVYLSDDDLPERMDVKKFHIYRDQEMLYLRNSRKDLAFLGVKKYMRSPAGRHIGKNQYFLKSFTCYLSPQPREPRGRDDKVPELENDPGYVSYYCKSLERKYRLAPLREIALVTENIGLKFEQITEGGHKIGLYKIVGKKY